MARVPGDDERLGQPPRGTLFWLPYRSDVTLALLAGGLSRRMGEDKAFAPFEGGTLLEWMRDLTAPLFPHVFVVAREPARFHGLGLPVVNDALPEIGSAVGVYTAVLASPTERVICLACDMPFVTPRLLRALADGSTVSTSSSLATATICSPCVPSTASAPWTPIGSSSSPGAGA